MGSALLKGSLLIFQFLESRLERLFLLLLYVLQVASSACFTPVMQTTRHKASLRAHTPASLARTHQQMILPVQLSQVATRRMMCLQPAMCCLSTLSPNPSPPLLQQPPALWESSISASLARLLCTRCAHGYKIVKPCHYRAAAGCMQTASP